MLRFLSGAAAFVWLLPAMPAPAPGQSSGQQGTSTSSQHAQDVPNQEPGTNNPDVGKQRHPATKPSSGKTQEEGDVPDQKPKTNNPDVGKQRHPTGRKKSTNSTSTSSSTHF